jgi:hypothetical protein
MFTNSFKWSARIITIVVCILASRSKGFPISPRDATPLDINLMRIVSQDKGRGTDVQKLEDNCLELLKDHNSPEDKGKIYAKIAFMYASKGYSSPNDIRIAKTAEYSRKALEQPLDLVTTCETYSRLSGAQIAPYVKSPSVEFAKARKEAIVTCLTGLKLALDNNAPKELGKSPRETIYNYDGPNKDEIRKEIQEKVEEQKVARKKWESGQKFYFLRRAAIERCASLYSHKPYDAAELENFAKDILKGHDDAIEEIMTKTRERIPQQGNK